MGRKTNKTSNGEVGNSMSELIKEAIAAGPIDKNYTCQFCGKSYVKESTLTSHICEQKRRYQQKNEKGVVLAFQAYLKFYQFSQGKADKTYDEFCNSPYYLAFVKFGRHIHSIDAINPERFIEYVIKSNKKLDHWCKDAVYQEYLNEYIRREHVQDALERSIVNMESWAQENHAPVKDFFRYASTNRITVMISNGRISPWCVYCSNSGTEMLEKLNQEQIAIVWPWIEVDYWQKRLQDYPAETEWCKQILKEAGF